MSPHNQSHRPILVTGGSRCGTTFVGEMLALAPNVHYIFEPFNLRQRPPVTSAQFDNWCQYVTEASAGNVHEPLARTLSLRYDIVRSLAQARRPHHITEAFRHRRAFMAARAANARPLIKDPVAIFSTEWLARTFDMAVVFMIRHPAAVASSIKRLEWELDFRCFLRQPLLLHDLLHEYEDEFAHMRELAGRG